MTQTAQTVSTHMNHHIGGSTTLTEIKWVGILRTWKGCNYTDFKKNNTNVLLVHLSALQRPQRPPSLWRRLYASNWYCNSAKLFAPLYTCQHCSGPRRCDDAFTHPTDTVIVPNCLPPFTYEEKLLLASLSQVRRSLLWFLWKSQIFNTALCDMYIKFHKIHYKITTVEIHLCP
jgi:hypothetical protein